MQPGSDPLAERVAAIAAEVIGERVDDLNARLELSPLGRAEFALALEEAFGVVLEDSSGLRTVAEASAAVAEGEGRWPLPPSLHPATGKLQPTGRVLLASLARWYFDIDARGADRIPPFGPVVLAANHESMWDIPLLVVASPRPIVFMAEAGVFGSRLATWFFTRLGGFPVRRGAGDLRGLRAALAVVRSNRVLGIYPEGTRRPGRLLPFRPGAAWVALATGAPIVPAGIRGTGEAMRTRVWFPRRAPVRIAFGEPVNVSQERKPRERLDQAANLTEQLRSEVERLIQS